MRVFVLIAVLVLAGCGRDRLAVPEAPRVSLAVEETGVATLCAAYEDQAGSARVRAMAEAELLRRGELFCAGRAVGAARVGPVGAPVPTRSGAIAPAGPVPQSRLMSISASSASVGAR
ncbi:MAG: hypothetical protein AAF264_05480 [Pseudomonadota bacterium]